jgi:ribosome-associated toxin RatA of RatAB toxin-antitoxin module
MLCVTMLAFLAAGADDAQLAKGEIVVHINKVPGSSVDEATAAAVIDAPPEVVWSIVSDCANYKNTMPSIIESAAIKSEKPTAADGANAVEIRHCRVVADLPFPFADLVSVTRGVMTVDPGKLWQRKWRFTDGDYNVNNGSWTVTPWGSDGKRALATYRIQAEPKVPLPGPMLASIQQGKLPEVLTKLRATAKKRAASIKPAPPALSAPTSPTPDPVKATPPAPPSTP